MAEPQLEKRCSFLNEVLDEEIGDYVALFRLRDEKYTGYWKNMYDDLIARKSNGNGRLHHATKRNIALDILRIQRIIVYEIKNPSLKIEDFAEYAQEKNRDISNILD